MDPYNPVTPEARALAQSLLQPATYAALATTYEGRPMVTRIGCLWLRGQGMGMLVSDLSDHSKALAADPSCALLVGEPGDKGDPLTHPRITLRGRAEEIDKTVHRDHWLAERPKAKLYYDFSDFRLLAIVLDDAMLNGGFGKAYRLTAADL
ncbi:MAG: pyridoxamine 5'-phosphate oxidase family protein [Pseudomonadota bacterium]